MDELRGERQAGPPAQLDPGILMKLKRVDQYAIMVEDRQARLCGRVQGVAPERVEGSLSLARGPAARPRRLSRRAALRGQVSSTRRRRALSRLKHQPHPAARV